MNQLFPIYVAHSPKMPERRVFMERQFEQCEFNNYEFITSFEIQEIKLRRWKDVKLNTKLNKILRGEFFAINDGECSLFLKHLDIYHRIIQSNQRFALVLEDDAVLESDFTDRLQYAIKQTPKDLDFLFLNEEAYPPQPDEPQLIDLNKIIQQSFFGKTSVSFIISKYACEKALESAFPISLPIDHYHNFIIRKYNLKTFWVKKGFVKNGSLQGIFKSGLNNKK